MRPVYIFVHSLPFVSLSYLRVSLTLVSLIGLSSHQVRPVYMHNLFIHHRCISPFGLSLSLRPLVSLPLASLFPVGLSFLAIYLPPPRPLPSLCHSSINLSASLIFLSLISLSPHPLSPLTLSLPYPGSALASETHDLREAVRDQLQVYGERSDEEEEASGRGRVGAAGKGLGRGGGRGGGGGRRGMEGHAVTGAVRVAFPPAPA